MYGHSFSSSSAATALVRPSRAISAFPFAPTLAPLRAPKRNRDEDDELASDTLPRAEDAPAVSSSCLPSSSPVSSPTLSALPLMVPLGLSWASLGSDSRSSEAFQTDLGSPVIAPPKRARTDQACFGVMPDDGEEDVEYF